MMKIIPALCLALLAVSTGMAQKKFTQETPAEYSVEYCIECKVQKGEVPFTIWVQSKKELKSMVEAKRAAVRAVLLQGVPGSQVASPLITFTQYQKSRTSIERFLNSSESESFVSKAVINPTKTYKVKGGIISNKGYEVGVDVNVQYTNLQRNLTQKKIIKFGL